MDESDPSDNIDSVAPWAIKAISKRSRDIATQAARRENLTVGQWLERLIMSWQADGGPAPVQLGSPGSSRMSNMELIEIARIAAQAKAAGQKGMSDAGQVAGRVLSARVRASEGLPSPVVRVLPSRKRVPQIEGKG